MGATMQSFNSIRFKLISIFIIFMFANIKIAVAEPDDKKEFMQTAIEKINIHNKKIDEDAAKIEAEGGKGALFVKIPKVTPFVDWDFYYLEDDLVWKPNPGQTFKAVTVPKGFVTDLASVPRILWTKYPPTGRYAYAAIVHDYLYWSHELSKDEADDILKAAMKDSKVDISTVANFHSALKLLGSKAWKANAEAKKNGEKRVLENFPNDPLMSWAEYKKQKNVFKD